MEEINQRLKAAVDVIEKYCPPSAETTTAIRRLSEARMYANQSIIVNER